MLLQWLGTAAPEIAEQEAERLQEINREMVRGFAALSHIEKAVSVFGSARTPPEHPDYRLATEVARVLGAAGYAVMTGAGPGIMEVWWGKCLARTICPRWSRRRKVSSQAQHTSFRSYSC
jgi:hypothetical protein